MGGNVEGGVGGFNAFGGDGDALDMSYLFGASLLDGNLGARLKRGVDGGEGGGNVEGDIILLGQHG